MSRHFQNLEEKNDNFWGQVCHSNMAVHVLQQSLVVNQT
jgi:hypothetical protein